ncbi:MAG TPA: ANTAR domain-containing protein [Hyphomicrobiaceae bacterium]|nr:ANTAR domain-containing protein [Hyphomicrobiaceae bacterium]
MAEPALHILVLDADRIRASIIEEGLREAGHTRVTVLDDMNRLIRRVVEIDPDVIVIDLENPSRDVLEHMFQISRAAKRPVAMFVDRADRSSIEAAIEAGVSAYVVDGLRKERIKPILDTAVSRFRAFDRMRRELDQARNELAERKTVERAKGILMRTRGLSEPDAYALLRTTAMRQSRRIAEIAESLITAAGLLGEEKS